MENLRLNLLINIIAAACILHNFCLRKEDSYINIAYAVSLNRFLTSDNDGDEDEDDDDDVQRNETRWKR